MLVCVRSVPVSQRDQLQLPRIPQVPRKGIRRYWDSISDGEDFEKVTDADASWMRSPVCEVTFPF